MSILLFSASLLMLLYCALSFNVSMARKKKRDSKFTQAELDHHIRIHGNAAEYIPLFIAVFLFFSLSDTHWIIDGIALIATASRVSHAIGMISIVTIDERHPLRFVGALGTYICLFAFGLVLFARAFNLF